MALLNLFRMGGGGGGGKKPSPPSTSFSSITSAKVKVSPQNVLTFIFNPFSTLFTLPHKLLNLKQDHPMKKAVFLVKSL